MRHLYSCVIVPFFALSLIGCDDGGNAPGPDGGADVRVEEDGPSKGDVGQCLALPELCQGNDDDCDGLVDDKDPDCKPGTPSWARRISGESHKYACHAMPSTQGRLFVFTSSKKAFSVDDGEQKSAFQHSAEGLYLTIYNAHGEPLSSHQLINRSGCPTGIVPDGQGGFYLRTYTGDFTTIEVKSTNPLWRPPGGKTVILHGKADGIFEAKAMVVVDGHEDLRRTAQGEFQLSRLEASKSSKTTIGTVHRYSATGDSLGSTTYDAKATTTATNYSNGIWTRAMRVADDGSAYMVLGITETSVLGAGTPKETSITPPKYYGGDHPLPAVAIVRFDAQGLSWIHVIQGAADKTQKAYCDIRDVRLTKDGGVALAISHRVSFSPDVAEIGHKGGVMSPKGNNFVVTYGKDGTATLMEPQLTVERIGAPSPTNFAYLDLWRLGPAGSRLLVHGKYKGILKQQGQEIGQSSTTASFFARYDQGSLGWVSAIQAGTWNELVAPSGEVVYYVGNYGENGVPATFGKHKLSSAATASNAGDIYVVRVHSGP